MFKILFNLFTVVACFSNAQSIPLYYPQSLSPRPDPASESAELSEPEEQEFNEIPNYQIIYLSNGDQVHRIFQDNILIQQELLTQENNIYRGEFDEDWLPHGHGTMEYANGETYTGSWDHGQRVIIWDNQETPEVEPLNNTGTPGWDC